MNGKTCIVTGANTGIGLETAAGLMRQGATVVLACRDRAKSEEALRDLEARGTPGRAVAMDLDLGSMKSIHAFADAFQSRFNRLDALVNNAGIMPGQRYTTSDGFEMVFGVNHLGHFLLTHRLLDLIKRSAPSRIVVVASTMHHRGRLNFDDLHSVGRYAPMAVYSNSKLANVMFANSLARRLEGSGVTVNSLHPGVVATNIIRKQIADFPRWLHPLEKPVMAIMLTPEKGARTSVYLASSPEVDGVSGKYFVKCRPARVAKRSLDRDAQERLWEISERATGIR
jgi:NAD(P)-dependent dehydrogenase (short-subunit alcohol dehydrogenase family)